VPAAGWENWSREQRCVPAVRLGPRDVAEVQAAVRAAADAGRTVRVAGAGHSFTPLVPTDGTLLDLGALNRVEHVDAARGHVRAGAGIRLGALSAALAPHGLALENLGDVDVQTLAGALATGTHGTGAGLPALHANVVALELVDGTGAVRELTGADELRAARVSLGALGVVTAVTLRCVPAFTLRGVDARAPLDDVLDDLAARTAAARHFELYVFPHARHAITRTNTVEDGPPRPPSAARRWLEDVAVANGAFAATCRVARARPALVPRVNRFVSALAGAGRVRVDRSDRIFASPRHVRFTEMELGVPRAAAPALLRAVKAEAERHAVPFPIELRFVAGDDAHLSPAAGRDTAFVAVHQVRGLPWEPYFRAVHALAEEHGARPHWGKRHLHDAASLAPRYPGWAAFAAVRAELDPAGTFTNAHVARVLGPVRAPVAVA
jgi:L-gulonolactone oxidase